jgi:hypothetical protein
MLRLALEIARRLTMSFVTPLPCLFSPPHLALSSALLQHWPLGFAHSVAPPHDLKATWQRPTPLVDSSDASRLHPTSFSLLEAGFRRIISLLPPLIGPISVASVEDAWQLWPDTAEQLLRDVFTLDHGALG